ncbi:LytTR family transcriptional regulator [Dyadobacter sp. CY261]|uniref:LytR/AlgR family response regulator transcription factor n=1 Tax=Dyadobacter sp. CY261 TaxID=2907203 RepID=UPI001F1887DF|nr:LytTR family DNA-binding domain-containing protein [Dyadobacter sp. CY261]MCF0070813.1 LytTR family transcriptional regulator [Dyadobacter sp. CY261]
MEPSSPLLAITARTHFRLMEIVYFESSRNYTFIILTSGRKVLLTKTLGCIAQDLQNKSFIRVSRSHLVNRHYLESIDNSDDAYYAKIKNGSQLLISRRRLKTVFEQC